MLRLQLEILSHFSYSDPEVLLQDLSAAVAFAESSSHSNDAAHPYGNGIADDDKTKRRHADDTDASISPPPVRWKHEIPANAMGIDGLPSV